MPKIERVRDWMGAPLVTASVRADMASVALALAERRLRHLPLVRQGGRVAGVVRDIDVFSTGMLVEGGVWVERDEREPRELARPPAAIAHPDDELAMGLAALRDANSDYALVLEEDGQPVGILTEHDAVRAAARLLPDGFVGPVHKGVIGIDARASVPEALNRMIDRNVRHLVVTRGGKLDSVVSVRDLMAAEPHLTVGDVLPPGVVHTMPLRSPMRRVAQEMKRYRIGSMIAVDEGVPVSITTRSDIVRALLFLWQAEESTEPGRPGLR